MAMIVAIMVSGIVLILSLTAISLAQHNTHASGRDRARTQAVHAAEAGVNRALQIVNTNPPATLPCDPSDSRMSGVLPTAAEGTYTIEITYYDTYPPEGGSEIACGALATSEPKAMLVTSEGEVGRFGVRRTMQSQVALSPILGGFSAAIFGDSGMTISQSLNVTGHQGDDGDVYSNGPIVCGNGARVSGSLVSQQSIIMNNGCEVTADAYAGTFLEVNNRSFLHGHGRAADGDITLSNNGGLRIGKDAYTSGLVNRHDKVGDTVHENQSDEDLPAPRREDLPPVPWDAEAEFAWQQAGYSPAPGNPYNDCAAANSFIKGRASDHNKWYVYIEDSSCNVVWANQESDTEFGADLAIITRGNIVIGEVNKFYGREVSGSEVPHDLFFLVPTDTDCGGGTTGNVLMGQKNEFHDLHVAIYSPCEVEIRQQEVMSGQIYGAKVTIGQSTNFAYRPVLIPGAGFVIGHEIDVTFVREIVNATS